MASKTDSLIHLLQDWASRTVALSTSGVDRLYVFGSLIHPDKDQFLPDSSDVDMLAVIRGDVSTLSARLEATLRLVDAKVELELALAAELGRGDPSVPIVSVVVASPEDLMFGIHKEGIPNFFGINQFLLLSTDSSVPSTLPAQHPCGSNMNFVLSAIRRAQKGRNEYLAFSANKTRKLSSWDGKEPVPKDLQRLAANVRYALGSLTDFSHSDLDMGLEFLHESVFALPSDAAFDGAAPSFAHVQKWFSRRRGARGEAGPMSPVMALTLWEILAERSYGYLRSTIGVPEKPPVLAETTAPLPQAAPIAAVTSMAPSDAMPTSEDAVPTLPRAAAQDSRWPLLDATASSLFVQGYPLVLVATAVEYARLAVSLADRSATYLLWTVNGSPLNVRGWDSSPDHLTTWDRLFHTRQCDKMRIVVFRSEAEREEYITPRDDSRLARREAFEKACDGQLRFTSIDLLRDQFPRLGRGSRLDMGFVSTEPPHLPRLGLCFYSPFASDDLGSPSRRRAHVVLFDTGRLVHRHNRDHEDVAGLLERLDEHNELIQAVRTGQDVDEWLFRNEQAVPKLSNHLALEAALLEQEMRLLLDGEDRATKWQILRRRVTAPSEMLNEIEIVLGFNARGRET